MSLSGKRILITPLNWGIGHASRCVPLIHALIDAGADVILGSDGSSATFLEKEIPEVPVLEMPGKEIRYGRKSLVGALLPQLPSFFKQIKRDHHFVKNLMEVNPVHLIISDNRYGCYHEQIPSILITHQLNLQVPVWTKTVIDKTMGGWVNKFSEVWVPDIENGLAGKLTAGKFKTPIKFLGPLSRIKTQLVQEEIPLLILLSGPEPQRSILEEKIWKQIAGLTINIVLVRGTSKPRKISGKENIRIFDLLTSRELLPIINAANRVVCRSGYSTLMDMAQLGKPALLIPTPGQQEQEYLGKYYADQSPDGSSNWAVVQKQDNFDIEEFINMAKPAALPVIKMNIGNWLRAVELCMK